MKALDDEQKKVVRDLVNTRADGIAEAMLNGFNKRAEDLNKRVKELEEILGLNNGN